MKRLATLLLLAAVFTAAACLPAGSSAAAFPAETVNRLLDDLIGSQYMEEQLYGDLLGVLDAFDRFDREKSWENLQKARAALFLAKSRAARLQPPETTLTAEDQMLILDAGQNTIFMEHAGEDFSGKQTLTLNAYASLRANILLDVFLQDDWEIALRHVRLYREITECWLQYNANFTDWILMLVDDPQAAEQFGRLMAEYCPLTQARRAASPVSMDGNEAASGALLDRVEELIPELDLIVGAKTDRLNRLTEQVDAGRWDEIARNFTEISGMPSFLLPYPSGIQNGEESYFWMENDRYASITDLSGMPDRIPDSCRFRIPGASQEDAEAYRQDLADLGVTPGIDSGEDGKINLIYMYDSSVFTLAWEDGSMTVTMLEDPFPLVPYWYLAALSTGSR